jgi:hypothetical protein
MLKSAAAVVYLEEAEAAFYADCLLASLVMLGVAAETEFLRLVEVAANSPTHGSRFLPATKPPFIRSKNTKFHELQSNNQNTFTIGNRRFGSEPHGYSVSNPHSAQ